MRYDLLVLDLDGTLLDSFADIHNAVNALLRSLDLEALPADDVRACIGRGVRHLLRCALERAGSVDTDPAALLGIYATLYERHGLEHTVPYPGVTNTLHALRARGCRLAVLSNKPEDASLRLLRHLGMDALFERVAGGDSFTEMKPSPLPLLTMIADLGVETSRTLMVGDSVYDIECARAAGVDACAVSYGFQPAEMLKALDPQYLVSAFDMIRGIVEGTIDRGQSKM